METDMLAYKIQKVTATVKDYVSWSHHLLERQFDSPSLQIISGFTSKANIFEIETYFQKALDEIGIVVPVIEPNTRQAIQLLAKGILQATADEVIVEHAHEIFHIVANLQYPYDLMKWYEISEMQDRLTYDTVTPPYNQQQIILKIREVSREML